jgi:hypothetical protein
LVSLNHFTVPLFTEITSKLRKEGAQFGLK